MGRRKKLILKSETGYRAKTQTDKNIAWFLPRPKKDRYKGGMPLHCEKWLIDLGVDILKLKTLPLTLNLFCGMNEIGLRVDIKPDVSPDICCDIHELSMYYKEDFGIYDIVLADPPYSNDEAKDLYGTGKLNYKKWTKEADKYLRVGGLLMIYHKYVMPNPDPNKYEVVKRVFIGNRTYHLPRVCIIFKKKL